MRDRVPRARAPLAGLLAAGILALAAVTTATSLAWVGKPFPGFFLLRNGVVASISLPGWPVAEQPALLQTAVVAIDGAPVTSTAEVTDRVRAAAPGTVFTYTFDNDGVRIQRAIPSQLFGVRDAILIFGVYLLNGLVFAATGLAVWMLRPQRATSWALLGLGLSIGVFTLTAMDLYGPHHLFVVHALAEAFVPGAFVHLALLFPIRRTSGLRAAAIGYLPCAALGAFYLTQLDSPAGYALVHSVAMASALAAIVGLLCGVVLGFQRTTSPLVRHRVRCVAFGVVAAFVLPAIVLSASVLEGGRFPVNAIGFTGFLFPLSVGYAVLKRDLFDIDTFLRRGFYYATLSGLVSLVYLAAVVLGTQVFQVTHIGSPGFTVAFTVVALVVLSSVRDRVQHLVDRLCGQHPYDAQEALAAASTELGSTLDLIEIARATVRTPMTVLRLEHVRLLLCADDGFFECARLGDEDGTTVRLDADAALARMLTVTGHPVLLESVTGAAQTEIDALGAVVVVPLACQGTLTGLLACGRKEAGTPCTTGDLAFLRAFANQAALSLQNARTFDDLRLLNRDLEGRVAARTHEVAASNERLARSLAQLEAAYGTLQASQEQLVSAEKMAAFGRLAAGIAHEMNTPLGAALNGLLIARELTTECDEAVSDESTPTALRRECLGDLRHTLEQVEEWTRKAVAYIRSVKGYSRATSDERAPIDVGGLLERELQPLLMHRLRLAGVQLAVDVEVELPEVHGDRQRLGQVLANLVSNAIDACEELPTDRRHVTVRVHADGDDVVLTVADRGTGVPADVLPRIFDEFFTTKPAGKGTGLGLSIAREIVTGEFGGTLACTTAVAGETTFTMRLPARAAAEGTRGQSARQAA
ncbi:MAG TPA: ATP-binding protein [Candidatus Binatia bacterium]|jgi:signal transduction histidine kinase|nr:ATP-binding protein [Candidatus Binatia bacterium]